MNITLLECGAFQLLILEYRQLSYTGRQDDQRRSLCLHPRRRRLNLRRPLGTTCHRSGSRTALHGVGPNGLAYLEGERYLHYVQIFHPLSNATKHLDKPLLWAINKVRKLPTFVSGRVALLGDAVRPPLHLLARRH